MAVLSGMNAVFGSKAICTQAVYFLHSTMPATCMRLSDVSLICRVTYLQFPTQASISSMSVSQAAQIRRLLGLANIGHRSLPKIWVGFVYGAHSLGNDYELILTVKTETRHPIEAGSKISRKILLHTSGNSRSWWWEGEASWVCRLCPQPECWGRAPAGRPGGELKI